MTASLRVEIFPSDLDRTIRVYMGLGFRVTGRSEGPPAYASQRLSDVRIGACEAGAVEPGLRAIPAGTELVVEVDDIRSFRDDAVEARIVLDEDLTRRPWGLIDFRVSDPDGYYLRFTARR
ncbi:VOC family protein [Aeromicrobium fastidiosum]|uniref:VOC family protein n=1 Tax=Aeromicrobium fastidiosum TaxID=52699 RepID=UPI00165FE7CB|nr:VOC family protein [Aeromicrobium fastidiosum]MBP2391843.1 catechol 2,3-dioxygenase-like lactoylglutathione lyase family enzyme [Aeromicrobium fastidiosum]